MDSRLSAQTAEAVAALFRAEAAGLFGYACTLPEVGHADAEDLVQVTFQAAATEWQRQLCALDPVSRRRWLYHVLRNKAIDQWRTDRWQWSCTNALESVAGPPQQTYHSALCAITLQQCWERITKMPRVRQRVALLKWGEEWSSAEIAELLGITQSTVRAHLKLARDELVQTIGPISLADASDDTDERWPDDRD